MGLFIIISIRQIYFWIIKFMMMKIKLLLILKINKFQLWNRDIQIIGQQNTRFKQLIWVLEYVL
ncbi:unnamed protein product [Paramecium pentaurelia]|uniref:Uncharacterized protein n=1 Tax=Paramecium pentaurelia TaxID=43138 RepID=A0A8S1SEE4_9CILI|nr:unnamed protein product [Paramecium pentaurelia]